MKTKIAIIGAGRIAYSLTSALLKEGYIVDTIISRKINSAKALAGKFGVKKYFDDKNKELAGSCFSSKVEIGFGRSVLLTQEELEEVKNRLGNNEKIPFEIELVRNAKDHLKFENYRMTSIEIQNAVEYLMSKIMTKYLTDEENKTDDEIDEKLKDFKEFRKILRKATFDAITSSKEFQKWDEKCAKLRHSVLHRGKQPDQNEAKEALDTGLSFLKILEKYK
ncbi:MAG: NAD(P)-binding domain-containing protein [Thaumarchaeota archaeon]|nr:NAD(P)-binding domain-containing protein [Nitrososphaerota archaeon]